MKLRLRGNSVRLRVSQSEMTALVAGSPIEETTHFVPDGAGFTYALRSVPTITATEVEYDGATLTVRVPWDKVQHWGRPEEVGIYDSVSLGARGDLQIVVEKDFACLDVSDEENADTFPNPNAGVGC